MCDVDLCTYDSYFLMGTPWPCVLAEGNSGKACCVEWFAPYHRLSFWQNLCIGIENVCQSILDTAMILAVVLHNLLNDMCWVFR